MEAANQYIRAEPTHDLQNPFVRTAAEQDTPAVLFHKKILLVPEILRNQRTGASIRDTLRASGQVPLRTAAGVPFRAVLRLGHLRCRLCAAVRLVRTETAALSHLQPATVQRPLPGVLVAVMQCQPLAEPRFAFDKMQLRAATQGGGEPNITPFPVIVRFKRVAAQIYRRTAVPLQERGEPAAVVIMPMRKHCEPDRAEVNPKRIRICRECVRLAHIK